MNWSPMGFSVSIRQRARALLALSWYDRRLFWQAWFMLSAVDVGLRVVPYSRIQAWLARQPGAGSASASGDEAAAIERTLGIVGTAAACHLYMVRCMPRALIGQWLLQRQGIAVDLRIGVRRDLDGLKAHAWLERGGQPIGEPDELIGRYAPLVAPGDHR